MEKSKAASLSQREKQLVELAAAGHTDVSISHLLGISESTVSTYWGRVRSKMGSSSRPELIAMYLREELGRVVEELRFKNRELLAELHRGEGDFYRDLVQTAPDAIIIVSAHGEIEVANEEALSLFGYDREQIEGHNLALLVPERFRGHHRELIHDFMTAPRRHKMAEHSTSLALHADGSEFPIAASLSPVEGPDGLRITCIVRRMTS